MKDKPGDYPVLANVTDRYAFLVTPCVTPPINNPDEKENIHDLVLGISEDTLITETDFILQLILLKYCTRKKTTYVGTIMPK